MYPNVKAHCFDLEETTSNNGDKSRLTVTHRLKPGLVQTPHYGLKLVERTMLPKDIMEEARKHANHLDAKSIRQRRSMEQNPDRRVEKLRLATELMQIVRSVEKQLVRNDIDGINYDAILARFDQLKQTFKPLLL